MSFGTVPLSSTTIGGVQVPASAVYVPETPGGNFTATMGAPGMVQTDASGASAPVLAAIVPLVPTIMQKANGVTGAGAKTLSISFANNNTSGNSIVVVLGMGEVEGANITLAVTDSNGNVYQRAGSAASQGSTLEATIFYASGIATGANTVTITISGTSSVNTAIAAEIYELAGLIQTAGALDTTGVGSNAGSTAVSSNNGTPILPNEYYFLAVAAGGGTITAASNWNLDSGTLAPTGGNLVSFGAASRLHGQFSGLTPQATLSTSNAWAACAASFRAVMLPVEGQFNLAQIGGVAPGLDQTNELRVSLYGTNSTPGDTAIGVTSGNLLKTQAQAANSGGNITNANPMQTNLYPGGAVQSVTNPSFVELTDGTNALGTSGNPIRTNPTGTTTQPVSLASLPSLAAGSATIGGVTIVDSGGTNKLAIDSSGRLTLVPNSSVNVAQVNGATPNLAQESGGNLATLAGVVSGAKAAVKAGSGDIADLAHGQATMANSVPVVIASNQSAVPVGPTAGTAFDTNAGTSGSNTLRTQAGGAATGTKSSVAASATSVTILASNTSRKGAIIFNDSTALLYLDLSGGAATSSSYSVQVPANSYFEVPGPNIYNGAITGVWASAVGNARVTEFS